MRFKELEEYGMTAGPPSYGSNAQGGTPSSKKPSKTPDQSAPVPQDPKPLQGAPNIPDTEDENPVNILDLQKDSIVKDENGEQIGVVVAPAGAAPKPEQVLVKTSAGKIIPLDPDAKYMVDEDAATSALDRVKKKKPARKLSKILKNRSNFQESQELFELNFNDKKLISTAFKQPIQCGFEVEADFQDFGEEVDTADIDAEYFLNNKSKFHEGDENAMEDRMENWYEERVVQEEYWEPAREEMFDESKDTNNYAEEWIEQEGLKDDYEEEKDDYDSAVDWIDDNRHEEEFKEYVIDREEQAGVFVIEKAIELAERDGYDRYTKKLEAFASSEFYSFYQMLEEFEFYFDRSSEGRIGNLQEIVDNWSEEYLHGNFEGSWEAKEDSSLHGTFPAEVASPVFSNPGDMLDAMFEFFDFFTTHYDMVANDSCGLHMTMSWAGEDDVETNKAKMVMLSGDEWLLKQFGRENKSYTSPATKALLRNLERENYKLADFSEDELHDIENFIESSVQLDRLSLNFKDMENDMGNKHIEFRIAGGAGYEDMRDEIENAVVRYSLLMVAGHNKYKFREAYIKKIAKFINRAAEGFIDSEPPSEEGFEQVHKLIKDGVVLYSKDQHKQIVQTLHYLINYEQKKKYYDSIVDKNDPEDEQHLRDEVARLYDNAKNMSVVVMQKLLEEYVKSTRKGSLAKQPNVRTIFAFKSLSKIFGITLADIINEVNMSNIGQRFPVLIEAYAAFTKQDAKKLTKSLDFDYMTDLHIEYLAKTLYALKERRQGKMMQKLILELFKPPIADRSSSLRLMLFADDLLGKKTSTNAVTGQPNNREAFTFTDILEHLTRREVPDFAWKKGLAMLKRMISLTRKYRPAIDVDKDYNPIDYQLHQDLGEHVTRQLNTILHRRNLHIGRMAEGNKLSEHDREWYIDRLYNIGDYMGKLSPFMEGGNLTGWVNTLKQRIKEHRDRPPYEQSDPDFVAWLFYNSREKFEYIMEHAVHGYLTIESEGDQQWQLHRSPLKHEERVSGAYLVGNLGRIIAAYYTATVKLADKYGYTAPQLDIESTLQTMRQRVQSQIHTEKYGPSGQEEMEFESKIPDMNGLTLREQLALLKRMNLADVDSLYEEKKRVLEQEKTKKVAEEKEEKINEVAYEGNIGFHEMMLFFKKASEEQKAKLREFLEAEDNKQAWALVQAVTGVELKGERFNESAVPKNDPVRVLSKLLTNEFLAKDIGKQMEAYIAIPDPTMLADFRAVQAQKGEDASLHDVLRNYAKLKLHPVVLEKLRDNLNDNNKKRAVNGSAPSNREGN